MKLISEDFTRPSLEDAIKILQENGVQVIYKAVALLPNNFYADSFGTSPISVQECDVFEALKKLKFVKNNILKDPFKAECL